jgi:hypothetical protein
MARTEITVQDSNQSGITPSYVAADSVNGMMFVNDGKTLLHVKNGDAAAKTVTITSVPDFYGRSGDLTISVAAGSEKIMGPYETHLFNQSGTNLGKVYVDFDADTSVTLTAIKL